MCMQEHLKILRGAETLAKEPIISTLWWTLSSGSSSQNSLSYNKRNVFKCRLQGCKNNCDPTVSALGATVTVGLHRNQTHTHTPLLTALCPGLPGWAGTRKVKPVSRARDIEWVAMASAGPYATRSRQITTPAPHHPVYRPDALRAAQPTVSKHWRH